MHNVREFLQHVLNPLHVFCRLRSAGLARPMAMRMSWAYEKWIFRRLPL